MTKPLSNLIKRQPIRGDRRNHSGAIFRLGYGLLAIGLLFNAGCISQSWKAFKKKMNYWGEGVPLAGSLFYKYNTPIPGGARAALEQAKEGYRQKKYSEAEQQFHRIARNKHTPTRLGEEALYYEAECLRLQRQYPKSSEVYSQLIKEFPRGAYHQRSLQRMFDIANYWLDDSRKEMEDRQQGKVSLVSWVPRVYWEETKPVMDEEGRALQLLETVYLNDIDGPLGEKAMFYLGSVHFFRKRYAEADNYFYQVVQFHPNGTFAPRALELSIICKQMATGGSDYDGRRVAEARELVHRAMHAYPELAHKKKEFLYRQLYTINLQQADSDFKIAEFYKRTGHPGSAYFYYEIVRRRYPGTRYAEKATKRMNEIRERAESEQLNGPGGISGFFRKFTRPSQPPQEPPQRTPMSTPVRPGAPLGSETNPEQAPPPRQVPSVNPGPGNPAIQPVGSLR